MINENKLRLIYGCMRLPIGDTNACNRILETALSSGFTHFDHADIYAAGEAEIAFGNSMAQLAIARQDVYLTSKCGIRTASDSVPKRYDFSAAYLIESVEGSLRRLQTDYLDCLLLHRPDYLMRASEVAEAFRQLQASGKVRSFGVSNFSASQVALLNSALEQPLIASQMEVSLLNLEALTDGTLDQCQQLGIRPEAWRPLAGSFGQPGSEREERVLVELQLQARNYQCEPWMVALAWLQFHPAGVVPVIGTTDVGRIASAGSVAEIPYSREEWYRLLEASRGSPVA